MAAKKGAPRPTPARGKARRLAIHIPADLSDKLLDYKGEINVSAVCRAALENFLSGGDAVVNATIAAELQESERRVASLERALNRIANFAGKQLSDARYQSSSGEGTSDES
jgi:hypothetical protein